MTISKILRTFKSDEDAAVTVDWVVLTAAIVGIALAVILVVRGQLDSAATTLSVAIEANVADGLAAGAT